MAGVMNFELTTADVLERLNDWHIDILKHNVDWGRLVLDAIETIERLEKESERFK